METMQVDIKAVLIELGIPTNLAGYRCLACAIPMYHEDPGQSVTKQLYPAAGQMCTPSLTGAQVEKLIRYAIDIAWRDRNQEAWKKYFPQDEKPTNWEFISRLVETLDDREEK